MKQYTIYCTPEQIRKALELGAPIELKSEYYHPTENDFKLDNPIPCKSYTMGYHYAKCPTAEQMLGWLRTKGFAFGITEYNDGFDDHISWRVANNQNKKWYVSDNKAKDSKEAIIAAIDAALEYLMSNKE